MQSMFDETASTNRTKLEFVIPPILDQTHRFLMEAYRKVVETSKKLAIDTTVGNGYDTAFLARLVGTDGTVVGCDIQESAIQSTAHVLGKNGLETRVQLIHCGHHELYTYLSDTWIGQVAAITANLGYLPRGDKMIITKPDTTRTMIETLLPFLRVNGVMTIVAYGGHAGGQEEVDVVWETLRLMPQQNYRVLHYAFINQIGSPSELFVIERVK